jgi:hypothetical protein
MKMEELRRETKPVDDQKQTKLTTSSWNDSALSISNESKL